MERSSEGLLPALESHSLCDKGDKDDLLRLKSKKRQNRTHKKSK